MINTTKLREYFNKFADTNKSIQLAGICEFFDFIESEQSKNRKAGVISLETRESQRKLKELKEKQANYRPTTPEEDFKNLDKQNGK